MNEGGILAFIGTDFHEDDAFAFTTEAVLENDESDEEQRGGDGDDGGGDEQAVSAPGFGEDEKVDRADDDAEDDEDEDEDDGIEGFVPKIILQRPCGIEVVGDR